MLSNQVKFLRNQKRITQKELSQIINVSQQTVGSWESGRTTPDEDNIKKLANLFGVSIDFLYGYDIPEWADMHDALDLDKMLESNVTMTYGGEKLSTAEKQRVKDILTGIFWERSQNERQREDNAK